MSDEIRNYPGNSISKKGSGEQTPEDKKVVKLVSGEVTQRKRPLGSRIKDTFTGEDARSVGLYLLFDVIIPAAKTMLADAASQGAERMLFGDSRPKSSSGRGSYTSYNRMYSGKGGSNTQQELSRRSRASHNFDEVVLESRAEAEEVLDFLTHLIGEYDVATVADFYELVGVTGNFTDNKWGWFDLRSASVRRVREGWLISLPKPTAVD